MPRESVDEHEGRVVGARGTLRRDRWPGVVEDEEGSRVRHDGGALGQEKLVVVGRRFEEVPHRPGASNGRREDCPEPERRARSTYSRVLMML